MRKKRMFEGIWHLVDEEDFPLRHYGNSVVDLDAFIVGSEHPFNPDPTCEPFYDYPDGKINDFYDMTITRLRNIGNDVTEVEKIYENAKKSVRKEVEKSFKEFVDRQQSVDSEE